MARDNTDLYYNFTVNTGSANGVELRDPVITADGLVGYVSEVYPTYSIVRSILDPSTEIGAQDSHTQENGVVGLNTCLLYTSTLPTPLSGVRPMPECFEPQGLFYY